MKNATTMMFAIESGRNTFQPVLMRMSYLRPVVAAAPVSVAAKPKPKALPSKVVALSNEDDAFGAGVLEEAEISEVVATSQPEEVLTMSADVDAEDLTLASDDDDGLTLSDDYDAEGLTLPADYDDGLTLPPEHLAASAETYVSPNAWR